MDFIDILDDDVDILNKVSNRERCEIFFGLYKRENCIIKVIPKIYYIDEINILKKLKHKNIVNILNDYESIDKKFIILEYVEGKNLYEWRKYNDNLEDINSCVKQICEAIEHIHKNNYIHGDLSLNNIMVSKNNIIKIIDFGESFSETSEHNRSSINITEYYAAPEILNKKEEKITKASDLWALGVILFFLIIGKAPFGENNKEVIRMKATKWKFDFNKYNIDKKYKKLLKYLLKKKSEKRKLIKNV